MILSSLVNTTYKVQYSWSNSRRDHCLLRVKEQYMYLIQEEHQSNAVAWLDSTTKP